MKIEARMRLSATQGTPAPLRRLSAVFDDAEIRSFTDFFQSLELLNGWFKGYFMNPSARHSIQPTPENLRRLSGIMSAINKHYPAKVPAEVVEVLFNGGLKKLQPKEKE